MDNSALTGEAILNAAAVWFIFKAIEVIVFMVYDVYSAIMNCIRKITNPDPAPRGRVYERSRGWLEYVWSGVGFLNLRLCRQRKMLLLFISTIIPIAVFVLELMSITLGNETRTCTTSSDPNVVSSPSLVLFGEGRRHGNYLTTIVEIFTGTERLVRPCISWSSTHAGVNFLSTMCGDLAAAADHAAQASLLSISNQSIGVVVNLRLTDPMTGAPIEGLERFDYMVSVFSMQSKPSLINSTFLGTIKFYSGVVMNGRNFLHQNAITRDQISEEHNHQLKRDVIRVEDFLKVAPSEIFEFEDNIMFVWEDVFTYATAVIGVVLGILAQTTREPIKKAAEMSSLNTIVNKAYDISCEEDFRLPRTASIVIIVVAVICRLILIFIPSSITSVQCALEKSKDDPV